jgi:dolichol-phosphate mannosyltransferase
MPVKLSVILPCFNEAENVPLWERELFPVLEGLPFPSECLVVDDGSADNTRAAAEALAQRRSSVRVLRHERNRGLGAAVRTGIAAARGDAILTLDSDLTFPPAIIPAMVQAFEPPVACVCASPFLGHFEGVDLSRRILSHGVNMIYRVALGQPLTAVSSICRIYRTDAVRALPLASDSFDINAEIIFHLLRVGAVIREVASPLSVRRYGVSKISTGREIRNHFRMFARIALWRAGAA